MSREDVIRGIVRRELEGGSLAEETVAQDAPDLHQAACAQFGAWATALHYAGVRRRRLRAGDAQTAEEVLQRIRQLCQRGGSLKAEKNRRMRRRLYEAAKRHFGTWRRALGAAGIDLRHANLCAAPRSLDRSKILAALEQRHRAGKTLRWGEVVLENRAFAMAARHAFGNWRAAMAAAGIVAPPVPTAQRKWDRQRVIAAIQERQQAGKSLRYSAVRAEAGGLVGAAKTYLGGWTKALAAAGIELGPPSAPPRRWTRQHVIETIQRRHREGKHLHGACLHQEEGSLSSAARRYFGSWDNALQAAGVEPQRLSPGRRPKAEP